jgi:protein KRI1
MYLKDYHRMNLLAGDDVQQVVETRTYDQEQTALKEAFNMTTHSDSEDELIHPKKKSKTEKSTEELKYQAFLKETLKDEASKKMLDQLTTLASTPTTLETEDGEAFLAKYLLNRGWLDPSTSHPDLYEDNSEEEDRAEQFETAYNFRFEAPGAGEVTTHARILSTTRRGDEKRKRERERKKAARDEEKRKEIEEIARLRNLKRMEIEERVQRVESVAGAGGWTERDLEGDFDPEEWDTRMQGVFDDEYYKEVCPLAFRLTGRRIRRNPSLTTLIFRILFLRMSLRKRLSRMWITRNLRNGRNWTRNVRLRSILTNISP